jgi:hypothetical protein
MEIGGSSYAQYYLVITTYYNSFLLETSSYKENFSKILIKKLLRVVIGRVVSSTFGSRSCFLNSDGPVNFDSRSGVCV